MNLLFYLYYFLYYQELDLVYNFQVLYVLNHLLQIHLHLYLLEINVDHDNHNDGDDVDEDNQDYCVGVEGVVFIFEDNDHVYSVHN